MVKYIFDGSFAGLLTALYEAFDRRDRPVRIISSSGSQCTIFEESHPVLTDPEKAEKISRAIEERISPCALDNLLYAFLSEAEEMGTWAFEYLALGWKTGKSLDFRLDDDRVRKIHGLSRKVQTERHRMLGLLRFQQLSGKCHLYYAAFAPDYNIIVLIAPHFVRRFPGENWMIHDIKRNLAAAYHREQWIVADFTPEQIPPLTESEVMYQSLWKRYHQSIALPERFNPGLQKQHMPMKYWPYLIEKN